MPTHKVRHPIQKDGVDYPRGSEITLTKEEALELADCIFNPPTPPSVADKDLAAALKSQADRPNAQVQDHVIDAETRRMRKEIEALGQEPVKATPVKSDAKVEAPKKETK